MPVYVGKKNKPRKNVCIVCLTPIDTDFYCDNCKAEIEEKDLHEKESESEAPVDN